MFRLALYVSLCASLGAAIGAAAIFVLAGGLPEGAIMGAILGGSVGALIGARMDAWRSATSFVGEDQDAAMRSAALLSARERQIRDFNRDASSSIGGVRPMKKLEDFASRAEVSSDGEVGGHGEGKR